MDVDVDIASVCSDCQAQLALIRFATFHYVLTTLHPNDASEFKKLSVQGTRNTRLV